MTPIRATVTYRSGDALEVRIRQHRLLTDQPAGAGGEDLGPTPTELFVASLGACAAFYAERYLRRHRLPAGGLKVRCEASMSAERPSRVGRIALRLSGLPAMPENRRAALLAVVEHCTVHNSLRQPPEVHIELAPAGGVGAAAS